MSRRFASRIRGAEPVSKKGRSVVSNWAPVVFLKRGKVLGKPKSAGRQSDFEKAELIIGVVCAVGVNYNKVYKWIKKQLLEFGYESHLVKMSDQIKKICTELCLDFELDDSDELTRIKNMMKAGNAICAYSEPDVLAQAAIDEIAAYRENGGGGIVPKTAHILLTLKRPEEVARLRQVYGSGFYLIGIFSTEDERIRYLVDEHSIDEEEARNLIRDDENDNQPGGQRTRSTFYLADVFVKLREEAYKHQLSRFFDLLFGYPYHTPNPQEYAMFMASAAAVRSGQLGRQVGASIVTPDYELLSVGCNEVPKAGGGLYWTDDPNDARDHVLGTDSNDDRKLAIVADIIQKLQLEANSEKVEGGLRRSLLFDITEFGRAVHAEMEAILSCVRKGTSTKNAILYTTTFPCHNCARHIVGAGIAKVVYIEPYPKSFASTLHSDSIDVDYQNSKDRVPFEAFVGIGPRRYMDLFTMKPLYGPEIERKENGKVIEWKRKGQRLRSPMLPISYIEREAYVTRDLSILLERINRARGEHG